MLAFDSTGYISEITINPSAVNGDSLVAGVGYGNHEGGEVTIYFRRSKQGNTLLTNHREYDSPGSYAELGYHISAADTTITLTTYSKQRHVIAQAAYRRIRNGRLDQLDNLNLAVKQLLVSGNYTGVDSLQHPAHVQFSPDGKISGWPGFKTYDVNTDFGAGPGNDIDHLILSDESKRRCLVHFCFHADTLRLYAAAMVVSKQHPGTIDEIVDEKLTRERLLLKLIRQ